MEFPKILRLADVCTFSGYRPTQIDELVARGLFPKPIRLSDGGRAKGWLEEELLEWRAGRIAARDSAPEPTKKASFAA